MTDMTNRIAAVFEDRAEDEIRTVSDTFTEWVIQYADPESVARFVARALEFAATGHHDDQNSDAFLSAADEIRADYRAYRVHAHSRSEEWDVEADIRQADADEAESYRESQAEAMRCP